MAGRASLRKLEDLDLTKHELNQIGEALKQEEFRKLLVEYVQEINDPENKKLFQSEVTQLEKERGYDVTFINPEPGYVIKTSADDEKKAFINVCKSDKIQRPSSSAGVRDGTFGRKWSLPYSQAPPREDVDNSGNRCVVYDVVFHPEALDMASWNVQIRNMLNDTALDGVENNYNVKLDRKNLKFPKMKYKGLTASTIIRKKSESFKPDNEFEDYLSKINYPFNEHAEESVYKTCPEKKSSSESSVNTSSYTTPKYIIKHRNHVEYQEFINDRNAKLNATLPKEIIVEVDLPLLNSTTEAALDVTEKSLSLVSEKPAKYKLFIALPYIVDENSGNAKFDKTKRKLVITLPLKHQQDAPFADFGREDSGVESDIGFRSPGSSSGEDENTDNKNKNLSSSEDRFHIFSKIQEVNKVHETEDSRSKSPVSVSESDVFRTNKSANKFLDDDKHYSFPPFTCNFVDNTIIFTLHVKNVDPNSVNHCLLENSCGVHTKFTSIGSGFFPIHHAFCTKLPINSLIEEESVNIETWDNNVIVQIQLTSCDINLFEYFAGVSEDLLVKHDLPEPTVIARKLEELKVESSKQIELSVEVTKCSKDETVVEISHKQKNMEKICNTKPDDKGSESSEDNAGQEIQDKKPRHPMLQKCRALSESSGDEMSLSPSKKGILKRVSRSLSESSADDYTWSSSLDMIMQSGSDSCIPEEDGRGIKKTVRFNEVVHQQTYRSNSSIFGQRKKNQRKTRNKKRVQERRASESENSEGESEKDGEKGIKTENNEENEEDEEANGNEDDSPEVNDGEEIYEVQLKLQDEKTRTSNKKSSSGQGPRKFKRKIGKPVAPPENKTEDSKVDLKNELIFDLDL